MPSKPFIRREVRSLPPGDPTLPAYARAVKKMKERETQHPRSWEYQAAMHGTEFRPELELWNGCKHFSWFFLAWHRMYVYYFEQIVREVVIETGGPDDWALPYWNYCLGGVNASIPDAFRSPHDEHGQPNPLYVAQRGEGVNGGAKLPPPVIDPSKALARPHFVGKAEFGGGVAPAHPQFSSFTGRVEQTPHNDVHNALGGWMQNPFTAAKDPIFWLHHTNIDRLWAEWNAHHHVDPSDPRWDGQKFHFFGPDGKHVSLACSQVVDTVKDLDYTYDPAPAAGKAISQPMSAPTPPEAKIVGANAEGVSLVGDAAAVSLPIDSRAEQDVLAATDESDPRRLYLNVEEIEAKINPGTVYAIYVNLPKGADEKTKAAHYAGNVSFFGIERDPEPADEEHAHSVTVSLEIGELLRELNGGKAWSEGQVDVSFVPLSLEAPEGADEQLLAEVAPSKEPDPPVQIGRLSLSVE